VFLDGKRLYEGDGPGGHFVNWDPRFHLVLGNEANGTRPWRGTLLLLALYSRPLSHLEIENNYRAGIRKPDAAWFPRARAAEDLTALYRFDEIAGSVIADQSRNVPATDLEVVSAGKVWQKPFLEFTSGYFNPRRSAFRDCAINVLIFVPFGFLAYSHLGPLALKFRPFLHAIVLGLVLSASAEILQYYSFTRQSSLNDISGNAFGSAIGSALAGMCGRVRRHPSYAETLVPDGLR
jgi:VanZ family protein